MANYFARKAGNINDADVWATTPSGSASDVWSTFTASDILHSNNFAITVNVSTTVGTVRNDNANSATNGGTFTLKPNQTLTANVFTGIVSSCLTFAEAGSTNVVGTINANSGNVSTSGITNSSGGTVFVTGNIIGGLGANAVGITNSASGVVDVTGNVLGSSGTAIRNSQAGTITVIGTVEAGLGASGFGHGIFNALTGIVQVVGSVTASSNLPAISSTNASSVVRVSGSFIHAVNGQVPVSSNRILLNSTPIAAKTRYALNGTGTYVDMFTPDNGLTQAVPADVRSGTVYADGNLTGTLAVPPAGSVGLGVPVDATTGTAALTPAAVWGYATRSITGGTVDTLVNAPTVPSAIQIRQEMDSNSTKLANLDAAVSSRLATSGYTAPTLAPTVADIRTELAVELGRLDASVSSRLAGSAYTAAPTTAQIATAVEGSLLNEADGQAVLNALVSAIGNTNLSEVSLVAAVRADLERNGGKLDSIPTTAAPSASAVASATRTELSTELSRIDQSISSRLAASAYTAPANSDITAIKAKTDLLNTDRLANVATTNIVGTLLVQANS